MKIHLRYCKRIRRYNVEPSMTIRELKQLLVKDHLFNAIFHCKIYFEDNLLSTGTLEEAGIKENSLVEARTALQSPFDIQVRTIRNENYFLEIDPDFTCTNFLDKFYSKTKNSRTGRLDPITNFVFVNGKIVENTKDPIGQYIHYPDDVVYCAPLPDIQCNFLVYISMGDSLLMSAEVPLDAHVNDVQTIIENDYHIPILSQSLFYQGEAVLPTNSLHTMTDQHYIVFTMEIVGQIKVTLPIEGRSSTEVYDFQSTIGEVKSDFLSRHNIHLGKNENFLFYGLPIHDDDLLYSFNSPEVRFTLSTDPQNEALSKIEKDIQTPARAGDLSLIYIYGHMLVEGIVVEKNVEEGMNFLMRSAEEGHMSSLLELARLIASGVCPGQNIANAIHYASRAAEFGYIEGMFLTGQLSRQTSKNQQAVKYLKMAIEKGHIESKTAYAHMILSGNADTSSKEEAQRLLQEAADAGDADALRTLAKLTISNGREEEGLRMMKEAAELGSSMAYYYLANKALAANKIMDAVLYAQRAVERGNVLATRMMGFMKKRGVGMSKDPVEAFSLFSTAAAAGDCESKYQLAKLYIVGQGCPVDKSKAVTLLQENVDKNHRPSALLLANMLTRGIGIAPDSSAAITLVAKFAERGDIPTTRLLGVMQYEGIGTGKDIKEATRNLEIAAHSDRIAQYYLGLIYKASPAYPANRDEVIRYFKLSADQNFALAQEQLGIILRDIDRTSAERYLRLAHGKGLLESTFQLGLLLLDEANEEEANALTLEQTPGADLHAVSSKRDHASVLKQEAAQLLKEASDKGHPLATYWYSRCLAEGIGVLQDLIAAENLLDKAITMKVPEALHHRGLQLIKSGHFEEGADLLREAAELGLVVAMIDLADALGTRTNEDHDEEILKYLKMAAQRGSGIGSFKLGQNYERLGREFEAFQAYREATKSYIPAHDELGRLYQKGIGTIVSPEDAFTSYRRAYEGNHVPAIAHLGRCYEDGFGTPQNYGRALELYDEGTTKGDVDAMVGGGRIYVKGLGVDRNGERAREYFEKAVAKGNVEAHIELAFVYEFGIDTKVDKGMSTGLFKFAAEHGNPIGMVWYARKLIAGENCKRDEDLGREYLQKAIDLGDKDAMFEFAELCYARGNQAEARRLYVMAADKGHVDAMNNAAMMIIDEDPLHAVTLWAKAAEGGNIYAMMNYGLKLAEGRSCVKDLNLARRWLREAADSGEPEALFNYGVLLMSTGVAADTDDALRVLKAAADKGHMYAMYNLAILMLRLQEKQGEQQEVMDQDTLLNIEAPLELLRSSADRGCTQAMAMTAYFLMQKGEDLESAALYAKNAMQAGILEAQLLYATMLIAGKGVPQSVEEGISLMIQCGDKGLSEAYYQYGRALYDGFEMPKNLEKAKSYFMKAAEMGNENAQLEMSTFDELRA